MAHSGELLGIDLAASMPSGIAMITETTVAAIASSSESGSRTSISSMTGRPVQSELPKSKRRTPQSHVPNCTSSG